MDEIRATRELYGEAVREKLDLEAYVDELHELLWAHGLEGRFMLHDETGIHEGTYAEFNALPWTALAHGSGSHTAVLLLKPE